MIENSATNPALRENDAILRLLLAQARLPLEEEEIVALARNLPTMMAMVESLYAVADVRYESPALIFDASPAFANWYEN